MTGSTLPADLPPISDIAPPFPPMDDNDWPIEGEPPIGYDNGNTDFTYRVPVAMLRISANTDFRRCSSFVLSDFLVSAVRRSQQHAEEGRPESARRILFVAGAAAFELARREGLEEEDIIARSEEILTTAKAQVAEFRIGDTRILRRIG